MPRAQRQTALPGHPSSKQQRSPLWARRAEQPDASRSGRSARSQRCHEIRCQEADREVRDWMRMP